GQRFFDGGGLAINNGQKNAGRAIGGLPGERQRSSTLAEPLRRPQRRHRSRKPPAPLRPFTSEKPGYRYQKTVVRQRSYSAFPSFSSECSFVLSFFPSSVRQHPPLFLPGLVPPPPAERGFVEPRKVVTHVRQKSVGEVDSQQVNAREIGQPETPPSGTSRPH